MWFLLGPGLSLRRLWKMCSFTLCSHLKGTEVFENKYPLIYTQDKKEQRENKSSDGLKRTLCCPGRKGLQWKLQLNVN